MLEVSWADGSLLLWILEELSCALHVPLLSSAEGSPVFPAVPLCGTPIGKSLAPTMGLFAQHYLLNLLQASLSSYPAVLSQGGLISRVTGTTRQMQRARLRGYSGWRPKMCDHQLQHSSIWGTVKEIWSCPNTQMFDTLVI